jgi:hypothetical protein
MSGTPRGGFFSRWSQLKTEQQTQQTQPAQPAPQDVPPPLLPPQTISQPADATWVAPPPTDAAPSPEAHVPAGPTLADVAGLTSESDFRPFVARHVAPAVKNAAFKKLFSDPHFNVMDGLDIYIDDYSQPSPLLPEDLKQMVAAKFMKLVEDDPPAEAVAASEQQNNESKMPLPLENKELLAIKIDESSSPESNQSSTSDRLLNLDPSAPDAITP